jgi:menaquinol-cytochrome c reductase iron-sulfur subunit
VQAARFFDSSYDLAHMSDETPKADGAPRRSFLTAMGAVAAAGLAGVAPVLAGIATLLDPLRRTRDDQPMVLVTKLAVVPDDGIPRKFTVTADRVDAWTTYQNTPVGAVYLTRTPDGIRCLNVVCPHAGCFVNLAPAATHFACPCHRSQFALDGTISDPASPSPRAMDELEVEIRNGDEVWVRFQNFQPGQEHKVPIV